MEKRRDPHRLDNPTESGSGNPFTSNTLLQVLENRPLLFWGSLWGSLFLVMVVSLGSLLSPAVSTGRSSSGAAIGSSSSTTIQEANQNGRIPLWLFGAIAVTCTAGSILVSKQLNRPQPIYAGTRSPRPVARSGNSLHRAKPPAPARLSPSAPPSLAKAPGRGSKASGKSFGKAARKRLKPYSPAEAAFPLALQQGVSTPYPGSLPSPTPVMPPPLRSQSSSPQPLQPRSPKPQSSPQLKSAGPQLANPQPHQPTVPVSVVPTGESHPLDWGTASIVDSLDLRKRRSLSSWLES